MRIVKFTAENFKRLKAVEITPDGNMVIIRGKNAQGKQQPISEPVLTPNGWVPIGSLKPGDMVIGSDGNPTKVLSIHPQMERKTYLLRTADGGSTRCGPDHLWTVETWSYARKGKSKRIRKTLTTEQMIDCGIWRPGGSRRFSLPNLSPVQYADSGENLPVDPYALGVILGDGHIELTGYVTITSADKEILDRIRVRSSWDSKRQNVFTRGTSEWSRPLTHMGLAGKLAHEKFIPTCYQRASEQDRRMLLAGLLDTDGTCAANWAEFSTSSLALSQHITELARGLGYVVNVNEQRKKYTYKGSKKIGRQCYVVRIRRGPCPFNLDRKIKKWKPSRIEEAHRFIDSIERVDDEESVCIRIANRDGLYVTKDFIITHNSSVLDAIWAALGGKKSVPDRPIRDDGDKAEVTLDIGDYVVTRTFTAKETYLSVKNRDGAKLANPQAILDGLVGAIAFDPLAFAEMKPDVQARTIARLVGVDFDALNNRRKAAYDARTDANREVKRLAAECAAIASRYPNATAADRKPVDVGELNSEYQKAQAVQNAVDGYKSRIVTHSEVIRGLKARRESLLQQISEVNAEIAEETKVVEESQRAVDGATIPDIQAIVAKIGTAGEHNKTAADLARYDELKAKLTEAESISAKWTAEIEEVDAEKSDMMLGANLPVNGLEFDENGVKFKGTPFAECASSEQLKISTVLAMRMNPKLRVARITDGSLLDDDSMKMLSDLCKDEDFQLWIERVDSSPDGPGVLIQDGEVVAPEGE